MENEGIEGLKGVPSSLIMCVDSKGEASLFIIFVC